MGYYDYTNKISELLNDARYELSEKEFMNLIDDIIYMAEEWKGWLKIEIRPLIRLNMIKLVFYWGGLVGNW